MNIIEIEIKIWRRGLSTKLMKGRFAQKEIPGHSLALPPKGFTLIECIIFIVIVGVFLVHVVNPLTTGLSEIDTPEIVASAVFLAEARREELVQAVYSSITSDATPVTLTGNYSAFSRKVTVALVDANLADSASDQGYKKVDIRIYHSKLPVAGIGITTLFTNYTG